MSVASDSTHDSPKWDPTKGRQGHVLRKSTRHSIVTSIKHKTNSASHAMWMSCKHHLLFKQGVTAKTNTRLFLDPQHYAIRGQVQAWREHTSVTTSTGSTGQEAQYRSMAACRRVVWLYLARDVRNALAFLLRHDLQRCQHLRLYNVDYMTDELYIRKDSEGRSCDLIEVLAWHLPRGGTPHA